MINAAWGLAWPKRQKTQNVLKKSTTKKTNQGPVQGSYLVFGFACFGESIDPIKLNIVVHFLAGRKEQGIPILVSGIPVIYDVTTPKKVFPRVSHDGFVVNTGATPNIRLFVCSSCIVSKVRIL